MNDNEFEQLPDHDKLTIIGRDMCWVKKQIGNHLKHHFIIEVAVITALLTTVGTLVVVLIKG